MGLAKRIAELCRDMSGIQRAVARDLKAGESFIAILQIVVVERKFRRA